LNSHGEEEVPHNLPQDDLIVANSGHGCSICCREHNMCLECGHKPFATENTGILYHYFLSCNHRDEDSVYWLVSQECNWRSRGSGNRAQQ
jgi:hypothetical protein